MLNYLNCLTFHKAVPVLLICTQSSERIAEHDKQTKLHFLVSANKEMCLFIFKNYWELKQTEHIVKCCEISLTATNCFGFN